MGEGFGRSNCAKSKVNRSFTQGCCCFTLKGLRKRRLSPVYWGKSGYSALGRPGLSRREGPCDVKPKHEIGGGSARLSGVHAVSGTEDSGVRTAGPLLLPRRAGRTGVRQRYRCWRVRVPKASEAVRLY